MKIKYSEAFLIKELKYANRLIVSRYNYSCGLEDGENKDSKTSFFFNSPNGQNGELYYELKKLGWRHSMFKAEYHWSVCKENCRINYTEGDIYIFFDYGKK